MNTRSAFQPRASTRAYYTLNGNSRDFSGNTNTGTDTAITYPQGRFGQGARFDGSTSKIAIGTTSTLQLSPTVTVSAWFKTSSSATQIIFSKDSQATGGYLAYGLYVNDPSTGNCKMRVRTATGVSFSDLSTTGLNLNDNRWHHIVGTYDAGTQQIFIDGIRRNLGGSGTVIHYATPQIPNIGVSSVSDNWFNGQIDEVIIENRAWTAKEVETYYRKSLQNYKQMSLTQNFISFLITEVATLTEAFTSTRARNFSVTETATLTESVTARLGKLFSVSDTVNLTETFSSVRSLIFGVAESVGLTEVLAQVRLKWNYLNKSSTTFNGTNKASTTWNSTNKGSDVWTNDTKS